MDKKILLTALFFGAVSIILGAFGAHALKKVLNLDQLASFEVGVRYMMYHALFLLFLGTTSIFLPEQKNMIFNLVASGTLFFSVSIFLLSTQSLTGLNLKFLGPITPVGGVLLISAWIMAFCYIFTKKN
ncbi:DUF423 domain-containing protein [Flavobacterium oreochromis]|uniref:DUF423 domain-containing protein n=1 Tax=Flavobacterium oreochromis TaxID=2906078 RepID=UPI000CDAC8C9|nr:DUF423 domain-containing protein [Flavobacterium oreochromis]POR30685.1 hypothetical protein BWK58_00735 [Flavobacterium columnare]QYS87275.1 DUF423 domain-containing protein [Flavobacterium oreochromis]